MQSVGDNFELFAISAEVVKIGDDNYLADYVGRQQFVKLYLYV